MLAELSIFAGINSALLSRLEAEAPRRRFAAGQTIFSENEPGESLFVITSGAVEISRDAQKVAELPAGAFFGELALISDLPRSATARAAADSELLEISRELFHSFFGNDLALSYQISRAITQRLNSNAAAEGSPIRPGSIQLEV